ncbi:hypothetical protein GS399_17850 [Pedobacter sp. HMF7647]|uniref:Uncharacterized protein n=1 Tax=Hufsiella arboris TaxID=2695275 RepID=A0A7K1YEL2_9SPHI|nr:hypothetical protein [Hufsiella arboris]MXV52840.1 hypothetical protein [Hufsiella arboris]
MKRFLSVFILFFLVLLSEKGFSQTPPPAPDGYVYYASFVDGNPCDGTGTGCTYYTYRKRVGASWSYMDIVADCPPSGYHNTNADADGTPTGPANFEPCPETSVPLDNYIYILVVIAAGFGFYKLKRII